MSANTVSVFNNTLSKTNVWLEDVLSELDWDDPEKAYKALRVVLHQVRDLLPVKEVTDLSAQLPMLIRGFYFEGWNPNHQSKEIRTAHAFYDHVNQHFIEHGFWAEEELADPEQITQSVLKVVARHVSPGEIEDVIACLPKKLREIWT